MLSSESVPWMSDHYRSRCSPDSFPLKTAVRLMGRLRLMKAEESDHPGRPRIERYLQGIGTTRPVTSA